MTYISLFSSAGIGCYGFKQEGFHCIATNELIPRRLDIQKYNNKCKYDSGYICGDISAADTKKRLLAEVELWRNKEGISQVDVVIATPPCQGMSVANHKKSKSEIVRNSLVVESIKIIKELNPKFFILENVPLFMKTVCTDVDGVGKPISEAIKSNLGTKYSYYSQVINFKNYGACSSRQRIVVIGVRKDLADEVSPLELYPAVQEEKTLRQTIGQLPSLSVYGEISATDIYHSFRAYPEHMRTWISDLKEGQSAFENKDDLKKPHQILDGKLIINAQKNGDKYRRQYWDKVGPCIHTRNDQLASQNTIHPTDDRVFSIRELMLMMTVPASFQWSAADMEQLNTLPLLQKKAFLKKEEIKIRQSLGEAVPTAIFRAIAANIKQTLGYNRITTAEINRIVNEHDFKDVNKLVSFIQQNPCNLSLASLSRIAELSNALRTENAAFFTNKAIITEIVKALPDTEKKSIRILEPSVGIGNFIPLLLKKFDGKQIVFDLIDVDAKSLLILSTLLQSFGLLNKCTFNCINDDFLLHDFPLSYDYIVGNPPFYKMNTKDQRLSVYRSKAINQATTNICSFFMDKAVQLGKYVALVFPKFILNTPEFEPSRAYLAQKSVECIIDFGEKGFPGVLVETIALIINTTNRPKNTRVISMTHDTDVIQKQAYIFDNKLPYWIIYRNELFDNVSSKLMFDVFTVFRDRQITKKLLHQNGDVRVVKSRNINDTGTEIVDIDGYDSFISIEESKKLAVGAYLNRDDVYITPNMTYNPRVMRKPGNTLVNGSVAILIPKGDVFPTLEQLLYFSSPEYRQFYQIARNRQTRSLNVDSCSVYFYGLLKKEYLTQYDRSPVVMEEAADVNTAGN